MKRNSAMTRRSRCGGGGENKNGGFRVRGASPLSYRWLPAASENNLRHVSRAVDGAESTWASCHEQLGTIEAQ
jgi:hypothetical protein